MGQGLLGPRGWALETGSLVEARLGEAGVGGRRGWALVTWVLEGHIGCPRHLKPVGLGTGLGLGSSRTEVASLGGVARLAGERSSPGEWGWDPGLVGP